MKRPGMFAEVFVLSTKISIHLTVWEIHFFSSLQKETALLLSHLFFLNVKIEHLK